MLGIAAVWAAGGAAAAVYWRALRRAQRTSPPLPAMDPLLTVRFRATAGVGGWSSGNVATGEVAMDARFLVLSVAGGPRAVVERSRVRRLARRGVFGYEVEHDGDQRLTFAPRRREQAAFVEQARRLGWPLAEVGSWPPPPLGG